MKKILVFAALAVALPAVVWFGCGSGGGEDDCASVPGNYSVNKSVSGLSCKVGGLPITLTAGDGVMPSHSALDLNQGGCSLVALDGATYGSTFVQIPYLGTTFTDDKFRLSINTSTAPPITMGLQYGATNVSCDYTASITWNGNDNGGGHLSGSIANTFTLAVGDTTPGCPQTCTINQSFSATRY